MKALNKYIAEYYQGNKYLGSITHDGEVPQEQVGYYGQRKVTQGEVRLKRLHKASEANPLTVIYYNLQGRITSPRDFGEKTEAKQWHARRP